MPEDDPRPGPAGLTPGESPTGDVAADEERCRRASEVALRAVQEAVEAAERADTARGSAHTETLEQAVRRAREMVKVAREMVEQARGIRGEAVDSRARARRRRDVARSEKQSRGFIAMVTWGRRRLACPGCERQFVVSYRCASQQPEIETEVACPRCGAPATCRVPQAAYAFSTRAITRA